MPTRSRASRSRRGAAATPRSCPSPSSPSCLSRQLQSRGAARSKHPPTPRHHVLVAQEQDWIVGFVAAGPALDLQADDPEPDATLAIGPLLVEPRWGRRGHGSRLLAAAVDTARLDQLIRAIAWLPEADETSRAFFGSAGWAADGYARVLDTGAGELREVRIHASLAE